MNKIVFLCIFFLFFTGSSFSNGNVNLQKLLQKDLEIWENDYYSADIVIAEKGTKQLIEKIIKYKEMSLEGVNYNYLLGLMYTRLYLIKVSNGDYEKANDYYILCLELLNKSGDLSSSEIELEQKKIIEFIKKADCEYSIKWMKCDNFR